MYLKELINIFFSFDNKFVVYSLVNRNIKLKYRQSILGVLWTILIPAFSAFVYFFVFRFIVKVKIDNYLLFVLTGVIPWAFFSQSLILGLESVVGNYNILNKVPVRVTIFPFAEVTTTFINLLLSIPVFFAVTFLTGAKISIFWLNAFPLILILFLQAYFFAVILSILFVYLRDLRHILVILIQVWFYLTPVLYSADMIPVEYSWLKYANPVFFIFSGLHDSLVFGQPMGSRSWAAIGAWTVVIFVVALFLYRKNYKTLVERI